MYLLLFVFLALEHDFAVIYNTRRVSHWGFAVVSHWIRTGFALANIAETWAALRRVRPVDLQDDATDLGGTRAMVHVRLDLTDLERGWRHVGRHDGDGRHGAPGPVCGDSRDRWSKAIRLESTQ